MSHVTSGQNSGRISQSDSRSGPIGLTARSQTTKWRKRSAANANDSLSLFYLFIFFRIKKSQDKCRSKVMTPRHHAQRLVHPGHDTSTTQCSPTNDWVPRHVSRFQSLPSTWTNHFLESDRISSPTSRPRILISASLRIDLLATCRPHLHPF